jgi:hypothetical protein
MSVFKGDLSSPSGNGMEQRISRQERYWSLAGRGLAGVSPSRGGIPG